MGVRPAGLGPRREPRTGTSNLLVFLGLLPLDILVGGGAWLAAGMQGWAAAHTGEDPVLPMTELLWSGGVLAAPPRQSGTAPSPWVQSGPDRTARKEIGGSWRWTLSTPGSCAC
ncbi:hypothetical protein [Streptomyces parvus]|uniref:hypothetical protein n=1 Tax=Streptomyces parvus TaxID=66428 RepID=UPI0036BDE923